MVMRLSSLFSISSIRSDPFFLFFFLFETTNTLVGLHLCKKLPHPSQQGLYPAKGTEFRETGMGDSPIGEKGCAEEIASQKK